MLNHLWGHVGFCPSFALIWCFLLIDDHPQAQINYLNIEAIIDEYILGFYVQMCDVVIVHILHSIEDLKGNMKPCVRKCQTFM